MDGELLLLTCAGEMGENCAQASGLPYEIIDHPHGGQTTSEDTYRAAQTLRRLGVDLLLFAGGDGTARDIYRAVGDTLPVLGIPAGVKIHSAVYAVNPQRRRRPGCRIPAGQGRTGCVRPR